MFKVVCCRIVVWGKGLSESVTDRQSKKKSSSVFFVHRPVRQKDCHLIWVLQQDLYGSNTKSREYKARYASPVNMFMSVSKSVTQSTEVIYYVSPANMYMSVCESVTDRQATETLSIICHLPISICKYVKVSPTERQPRCYLLMCLPANMYT